MPEAAPAQGGEGSPPRVLLNVSYGDLGIIWNLDVLIIKYLEDLGDVSLRGLKCDLFALFYNEV